MDKRVRKCAIELEDTVLQAKLSVGDLISQEAVKGLASLYKTSHLLEQKTDKNDDKIIQGIALAQLVEYIEETRTESEKVPVSKLADLAKMYTSRLQQLGGDMSV